MSEAQSQDVGELFGALAKVQATLPNVGKDSKGYGYNYASLGSLLDLLREKLSTHDLCIVQTTEESATGKVIVVTTLGHASGQWIRGRLALPPTSPGGRTNEAQAIGSSISYARRYAIAAIVGITQEDDDAASLSRRKEKRSSSGRNAAVHKKPEFKDYGDRPKPSARIKTLADAKKRFPDISLNSKLKQIDYGIDPSVPAIKECIGRPLKEAQPWIDYVTAHVRSDWSELDDRARALCLWARELTIEATGVKP